MFFHTSKRNENRILISLHVFQTILITCTKLKEILLTNTSRLRIIEKIWLPFQCIKQLALFLSVCILMNLKVKIMKSYSFEIKLKVVPSFIDSWKKFFGEEITEENVLRTSILTSKSDKSKTLKKKHTTDHLTQGTERATRSWEQEMHAS